MQQKPYQYLIKGDYEQAVMLYEEEIALEPQIKSNYWYLGLALLLQGEETEAQTTWMLGMLEGEPEEIDEWTTELIDVLETEAERRRLQGVEEQDYFLAWTIRQHIREINPENINNLLHLIGLSTLLKTYTVELLEELSLVEILNSEIAEIDEELLMQVLKGLLNIAPLYPSSFDLVKASLSQIKNCNRFLDFLLLPFTYKLCYGFKVPELASRFVELGLTLVPDHIESLMALSTFYQDGQKFSKGIDTAKLVYSLVTNLLDKLFANLLLMRAMMSSGGYWDQFCETIDYHKSLLSNLVKEKPTDLSLINSVRLLSSVYFLPYFQDSAPENAKIISQISEIATVNIEKNANENLEWFRNRRSPLLLSSTNQKLKIGYISYCFRTHSVGWLARWLIQHHNREQFEIYGYLVSYQETYNQLQEWYISQFNKAHKLDLNGQEVATKVYEDEINILVDLDSLTMNNTCTAMALKPAPVQVTWLGWDASQLSAIDYFIADPYVLPENAQDYYTEKIWRLPQTYLAVDGFEVGVPNLFRHKLDIPSDAVIYLSGQRGYKYNPNTAKLQMQIIKAVPNSYFLLKGLGDQESLQNFFIQIAESEGVSANRLRFVPFAASEEVHRANLAIADVVLDTYPYNGATTTMETLWMCVPLVTRVGQQFAARNSYTMMMNAGITEGIAWTDEEYVEWGIRFGTDEKLRQQVSWKLRQSKQTAPLWNGKQFTREMEKAYQQMWEIYQGGEK